MSQNKFSDLSLSWMGEDMGTGLSDSTDVPASSDVLYESDDCDEEFFEGIAMAQDTAFARDKAFANASTVNQQIMIVAQKLISGEPVSINERKYHAVLPLSTCCGTSSEVQQVFNKYSKHILQIQDSHGKQYIVFRSTSRSNYKPIPDTLLETVKDAVCDRELVPLPSQLGAGFRQLHTSSRKKKLTQSFGMNFGRKYLRECAKDVIDLFDDEAEGLFHTLDVNYKLFNNLGEDYSVLPYSYCPPPDIHASFPDFEEKSLACAAGLCVGEKIPAEREKSEGIGILTNENVSESDGVPQLPQSTAASFNDPFADDDMHAALFGTAAASGSGGDFLASPNLDAMPLDDILARFVNDDTARMEILKRFSVKDACIKKLENQSVMDISKIQYLECKNGNLQGTIDERDGEVLQLHLRMEKLRVAPPAWQQEKETLNARVGELEEQLVRLETLLPFTQMAQRRPAESPRLRIEALEQENKTLESKATRLEQALYFEEQDHRQTKADKDLALRQLAFEKEGLELQVEDMTAALELERGSHGETLDLADRYKDDMQAAITEKALIASKVARLKETIEQLRQAGNATVMSNIILDMYRRNEELEGKIVHLRTRLGIPKTTALRPLRGIPNSVANTPETIRRDGIVHSPRTPLSTSLEGNVRVLRGHNNFGRRQGDPYSA